jgi:hypothetical protein
MYHSEIKSSIVFWKKRKKNESNLAAGRDCQYLWYGLDRFQQNSSQWLSLSNLRVRLSFLVSIQWIAALSHADLFILLRRDRLMYPSHRLNIRDAIQIWSRSFHCLSSHSRWRASWGLGVPSQCMAYPLREIAILMRCPNLRFYPLWILNLLLVRWRHYSANSS